MAQLSLGPTVAESVSESRKPSPMGALPTELVELILLNLPIKARAIARGVCSRWKGLADQSFAKVKR